MKMVQVSTGQALASIETLKTFLLQQPYYCHQEMSMLQMTSSRIMIERENRLVQSKIMDFFSEK